MGWKLTCYWKVGLPHPPGRRVRSEDWDKKILSQYCGKHYFSHSQSCPPSYPHHEGSSEVNISKEALRNWGKVPGRPSSNERSGHLKITLCTIFLQERRQVCLALGHTRHQDQVLPNNNGTEAQDEDLWAGGPQQDPIKSPNSPVWSKLCGSAENAERPGPGH